MKIKVEVSVGELIDKLSILDIKSERIKDEKKLVEIEKERQILEKECKKNFKEYEIWLKKIKKVNEELWEVEDLLREKEKNRTFNHTYKELARRVYHTNDIRFKIKDEINRHYNSEILEQKSYKDYAQTKEKFEKINNADIKKILLIRNDKIGDIILVSGVIRELKKAFPNAEIHFVASPENKSIIEKNKHLSKIFLLRYKPKKFKEIFDYFSIAKKIKAEKYDFGFDLRGSLINDYFILKRGKVKYKAGFYKKNLAKKFLDFPIKRDTQLHESMVMLDMMNNVLQTNLTNFWPDIQTSKEDEEIVDNYIKENKLNKFICVNPDGSYKEVQWQLEKWDELLKWINKKYPRYKIILTGGDMDKINYLLERNHKLIMLEQEINNNLRSVYYLFKKSSLVLSQEGGLMHLAWVSKANLIALRDGCNTYEHSRPLQETSINIYNDMNKINVEEVEKAVSKFLKK